MHESGYGLGHLRRAAPGRDPQVRQQVLSLANLRHEAADPLPNRRLRLRSAGDAEACHEWGVTRAAHDVPGGRSVNQMTVEPPEWAPIAPTNSRHGSIKAFRIDSTHRKRFRFGGIHG